MIKNIIFDLGGVIVSLNRKNCVDAFSNILGFHNFGDYLSAYAQKGFFAQFEDGAINSHDFREHVRTHSSNKDITDSQIDFALCAFLIDVKKSKIELLLNLKKDYNLFLLSNINPIAWEYSQKLFKESGDIPIQDIFDRFFLSYKMKKSKPDKAIFEQLIIDAQIKPQETLFIDDAAANIETANSLGFKTLLYDVNNNLTKEVMEALI